MEFFKRLLISKANLYKRTMWEASQYMYSNCGTAWSLGKTRHIDKYNRVKDQKA